MAKEYEGAITNISFPCMVQLEVDLSVTVEDHFLHTLRSETEFDSGNRIQLDIDLFEKYIGDEEQSNVPIIKYSTDSYAPASCGSLRLRTLNYFRGMATESPGVGDALEGCRRSHMLGAGSEMTITSEEDGTSIRVDASGAKVTDSCHKTFVYCCSFYESNQMLTRESARAIFGQDYTRGTIFRSAKELAQHIVLSFAATIGREMVESTEPPEGNSYGRRACAWIVHGPVGYMDDTTPALHNIASLFTKPNEEIYRTQNEYRFWVGFANTPAQSDDASIDLPVPSEFVTDVKLEVWPESHWPGFAQRQSDVLQTGTA